MTTESSSTSKSFDVGKYQIKEEPQVYTVKVENDEFAVTIKPITWQLKNEIIAKCMKFDANGNSTFDSGVYIREVLKGIILSAPWGKTDDQFLDSINGELGNALEKLVPVAFENSLKDVDVVKKG